MHSLCFYDLCLLAGGSTMSVRVCYLHTGILLLNAGRGWTTLVITNGVTHTDNLSIPSHKVTLSKTLPSLPNLLALTLSYEEILLHTLLLLRLFERIIRISCITGEEPGSIYKSPKYSLNLMQLLWWDLSLEVCSMADAAGRENAGILTLSQSFDTKTLALHLLLPQSYSLPTVLGSQTIRERFTHLSISNFL